MLRAIWGFFEHDLPHNGELSPRLGAIGLLAVEIQPERIYQTEVGECRYLEIP